MPRRQSRGQSEEGKVGASTSPFVFAPAGTILCDHPQFVRQGNVPLKSMEKNPIFKYYKCWAALALHREHPWDSSPTQYEPRCWEGVYWSYWSLSRSIILHRSICSCPLESCLRSFDGQITHVIQKNQNHGSRSSFLGRCFWEKMLTLIF